MGFLAFIIDGIYMTIFSTFRIESAGLPTLPVPFRDPDHADVKSALEFTSSPADSPTVDYYISLRSSMIFNLS
jgi:hypothetical protein